MLVAFYGPIIGGDLKVSIEQRRQILRMSCIIDCSFACVFESLGKHSLLTTTPGMTTTFTLIPSHEMAGPFDHMIADADKLLAAGEEPCSVRNSAAVMNDPFAYQEEQFLGNPSPIYCETKKKRPLPMRSVDLAPQPPTYLDTLPEELRLKLYLFSTGTIRVPNPFYRPVSGGFSVQSTVTPCKICIWNALYSSKSILHTTCPVMFRYTNSYHY